MSGPTELSKPVARRIVVPGRGTFVVTLTADGVEIRRFRKRRGVVLPYDQLAYFALQRTGVSLTAAEWAAPLLTLGDFARLRRTHGARAKPCKPEN